MFTDYIKFQLDKDHLVGMVLLDLQKAIDTLDHDILLMKMEALGLWLVIGLLTESVLFGSKLRLKSQSNLNISCKGTETELTLR